MNLQEGRGSIEQSVVFHYRSKPSDRACSPIQHPPRRHLVLFGRSTLVLFSGEGLSSNQRRPPTHNTKATAPPSQCAQLPSPFHLHPAINPTPPFLPQKLSLHKTPLRTKFLLPRIHHLSQTAFAAIVPPQVSCHPHHLSFINLRTYPLPPCAIA